MSTPYDHDFDHPHSHLNALEMAVLAARPPDELRCPHCHVEFRMLPMTGTAWGLEHVHEDGCPENGDQP